MPVAFTLEKSFVAINTLSSPPKFYNCPMCMTVNCPRPCREPRTRFRRKAVYDTQVVVIPYAVLCDGKENENKQSRSLVSSSIFALFTTQPDCALFQGHA